MRFPIIGLDEPTSALDKATEQEVLLTCHNYPDKTIIVVTHSAIVCISMILFFHYEIRGFH